MSNEDKRKDFQGKVSYLLPFVLIASLGSTSLGFVIASMNQTAPVLKVQFGWTDADAVGHETALASAPNFGAIFGTLIGSRLIQKSRRKTFMLAATLMIIGVIPTLFLNFYSILFGRII